MTTTHMYVHVHLSSVSSVLSSERPSVLSSLLSFSSLSLSLLFFSSFYCASLTFFTICPSKYFTRKVLEQECSSFLGLFLPGLLWLWALEDIFQDLVSGAENARN